MSSGGIQLTDGLVAELARVASDERQEWGAALFGTGNLLTFALVDDRGRSDDLSWHLSAELRSLIPWFETFGVGRFAGTVHSHPNGLDHSSRTDVKSTRRILSANPELGSTLMCIISDGPARFPRQLAIGPRHRLTADLETTGVTAEEVDLSVVSVVAGLEDAGLTIRSLANVSDVAGARSMALERSPRMWHGFGSELSLYPISPELGLILGVPANYPTAGPLLIQTEGDERPRIVASPWDPSRPPRVQVRNMVDNAIAVLTPKEAGVRRPALILGAGKRGSLVADALVRAGLSEVIVVDGGRVTPRDIAAAVYGHDDRGEWRVFALARHLAGIDPGARVKTIASPVPLADLRQQLSTAAVVVDAREDDRPLVLLDDARALGIPVTAEIADTLKVLSMSAKSEQ